MVGIICFYEAAQSGQGICCNGGLVKFPNRKSYMVAMRELKLICHNNNWQYSIL